MGLELGMTFKFYTRVATVLKLKFRKFCGLIPTLIEITGKKLVGERGGQGVRNISFSEKLLPLLLIVQLVKNILASFLHDFLFLS